MCVCTFERLTFKDEVSALLLPPKRCGKQFRFDKSAPPCFLGKTE